MKKQAIITGRLLSLLGTIDVDTEELHYEYKEIDTMLKELYNDDFFDRCSLTEGEFVQDMFIQFTRYKKQPLSEKQIEWLRKLCKEYC